MGLGSWESYLTNHIEGFFNKRFSSNLETAELVNGIEREIARQSGRHGVEIGNAFVFSLCPDDYHRLCAQRILDYLYTVIGRQLILQDCTMEGKLSVRMKQNRKLTRGMYRLRCFQESVPAEPDQTLVLERPCLDEVRPLSLPVFHPLASLTVVEGPDRDAYLELGEKQIYIGRRDKNEFILTDTKASRLHAWISYEHHRHELHDARSTNGTFVGGRRIESCRLQNGDTIRIGMTILRYEVI